MTENNVIECRTCTVQAIIDGETDANVGLCILADGDAASEHKAANPTHVIVLSRTYWVGN